MPEKEYYPVVRSGRLNVPIGPYIQPAIEINVEQLLSKVNRRLYRHGRTYDFKIDMDPDAAQVYRVYVLSDSWMNEKAFQMGYDMYLENSADERERLKTSNLARWADFRTHTAFSHEYGHANPVQFAEPPGAAHMFTAGEFDQTIVVDAAGVTKSFSWGPSAADKYSLLEEYDKAGNAQTSPDAVTGDMPYDDLMADDDAAMAATLQTHGNAPPYDATGVSSGKTWAQVATLRATTAGTKLSTGFFKAPCGFVLITAGNSETESPVLTTLQWTAKAGDYKGVSAPSLLDV
ncbi:MAG: putative replicase [Circoviridae sp.]|nr:MAG: putative replicase [Circoviridae sp.]